MISPPAQSGTAEPARSPGVFRVVHNLFIAALVFFLLLDGLPCGHDYHRRVKDYFSPFLRQVGLIQGSWKLFAPNPDHLNTWVEAKVTFSDESTWSWSTPNWPERSHFEKFIQGRHPKFWDAFRLDDRKAVHRYVADYAVRIAPAPSAGVKPTKVELVRHWWEVPAPKDRQAAAEKYGSLPPPREEFTNEYVYYTRSLP